MNITDQDLTENPDLFASEVHFCLLNGGVRSRSMRRLWKLAKGHSELERILEIKLAEFQRAAREARTPTLWNLPMRMAEWTSERVRFTPPREFMTTLAYVVFAVVAVDAIKSRVPWKLIASQLLDGGFESRTSSTSDYDLFAMPETRPRFWFSDPNEELSSLKAATAPQVENGNSSGEAAIASIDREIDQLIQERITIILGSAEMKEAIQKNAGGAEADAANGVDAEKLSELVATEVEARLRALNIVAPEQSIPEKSAIPDSTQVVDPASIPDSVVASSGPAVTEPTTGGTP